MFEDLIEKMVYLIIFFLIPISTMNQTGIPQNSLNINANVSQKTQQANRMKSSNLSLMNWSLKRMRIVPAIKCGMSSPVMSNALNKQLVVVRMTATVSYTN